MDEAFAELQKKLLALRGDVVRKAQRKALTRVGEMFEDAIRERAPIKAEGSGGVLSQGELQNSIHKRVSVPTEEGVLAGKAAKVTIGPRGHIEKLIASDVEYGHGPNTPAHSFIRVAFDGVKGAAEAAYFETMEEELQKATK